METNCNIPRTLTAEEIVAANYQDIEFVVPKLIPVGLSVFTGKAKTGKSIAALDIAMSVAMGGRVFNCIDVPQQETLYLALEDSNQRLKTRIIKILQNYPATKFFHSALSWPRMDKGFLATLESWVQIHPHVKLVFIDTFAKIRAFKRTGSSLYEKDYLEIAALKEFADKHSLAMVLIHHLRKGSAQDMLDLISGSVGLTAAADTILILTRERGEGAANLYATGRDIEERNFTLKLNPANLGWEITDAAVENAISQEKLEILELIKQSAEPLKLGQIAETLQKKKPVTHKHLASLINEGLVQQPAYGLYATVPKCCETGETGESSYYDY
jgi:RecA-family ATPase